MSGNSLVLFTLLILTSSAQAAPTSNAVSANFRSGQHQVSIPSASPESWPYGSTDFTYSASYTTGLSAVPEIVVTLSSLISGSLGSISYRLTVSYPAPSTTTQAVFSVSSIKGIYLARLYICYLAYLPFLLTPSFYIGKLEI